MYCERGEHEWTNPNKEINGSGCAMRHCPQHAKREAPNVKDKTLVLSRKMNRRDKRKSLEQLVVEGFIEHVGENHYRILDHGGERDQF